MTFFEAYKEMKKGKIVERTLEYCNGDIARITLSLSSTSPDTFVMSYDNEGIEPQIYPEDIEATNWEIVND